jgi:phage terminase large subunit GpA-like protein
MTEATVGGRIVQHGAPDGYAAGLEAIAHAFEPRLAPLPSEWAQQYRILSGKSAAEPGRWRNERIPYLRAVMDALDERDPAPIVVLVKSSQVGGSECGLNWIGRSAHVKPGSFLCLFPTEKVGKKWVRTRLDSMIATTPELRKIMPLGRRANSGNTLQEKHGPGFVLYVGSANIPDDVASISVPRLLLDEVDRMPRVLEDEGDPIELALMRSITFPRAKCFLNSTPTTEENSRIWPLWLSSTMHRYFVPCPECDHLQYLRWEHVTYPEGQPDKAAYRCESCAVLIEERWKTQMLAGGDWIAEHPERATETKGFHVNGLYTPIGLGNTWARHARAWERAKGSPEKMQPFYNTRLGEVVKSARQVLSWEAPYGRREPYPLRTIPPGVLFLTSGTDVQKDRLETQIVGWSRGERAVVIDRAQFYGDTTRLVRLHEGEEPTPWERLDDYLAQSIATAAGVPMRLACSLVDSGYLPDTVLGFTRERKARNIFATRGSSMAAKLPIGRPTYPDVRGRGRKLDRSGVERYEIGVSVIKKWIFDRLEADAGRHDAPVPPASRHIRFSDELPEEYFRQLTSEVFDPKKGWVQGANYHRNEDFDTMVLARAASLHHVVAIHRMREADWVRLEELYERPTAKPAAPEPLGKLPIEMPGGGFLPTSAKVR